MGKIKSKTLYKRKYLLLCCIVSVFCLYLEACTCSWVKYFDDYHVVWYCDDPFIEFIGDDEENIGKIILDGTEYTIIIANLNGNIHYSYVSFYRAPPSGEALSGEDLIWDGKAEVKDGKLYLTVAKDNVSTYEGKTIVLNQRPVEEGVGVD